MPDTRPRETLRFGDFELNLAAYELRWKDRTVRLERAYAARDVHLIFPPVDAKWDDYRDDTRFAALISRCGFSR